MKILALEFSSSERGIAVLCDSDVRGFAIDRTAHGTRSFELIQQALDQAHVTAADVECIAVGLGPGSYAGTRIAIAIAQGWQMARGPKLLGLSSAGAIARQVNTTEGMALAGRPIPFHGIANIVFDAQRDEVYAIQYKLGAHEPEALGGFELLTPEEDLRRREAGEVFVKGDRGPWKLGKTPTLLSDARIIGHMAVERRDFVSGDRLEPIYLRKAEFVRVPSPKSRAR